MVRNGPTTGYGNSAVSNLPEDEYAQAEVLVQEMLSTREWLTRVPYEY